MTPKRDKDRVEPMGDALTQVAWWHGPGRVLRRLGFLGPLAVFAAVAPVIGGVVILGLLVTLGDGLRQLGAWAPLAFVGIAALLGGLSLAPTHGLSLLGGYGFGFTQGLPIAMVGLSAGNSRWDVAALFGAGQRRGALGSTGSGRGTDAARLADWAEHRGNHHGVGLDWHLEPTRVTAIDQGRFVHERSGLADADAGVTIVGNVGWQGHGMDVRFERRTTREASKWVGMDRTPRMTAVGARESRLGGSKACFSAAAETLRRILVDQARRKQRLKRGGPQERVEIDSLELATNSPPDELLRAHEALAKLASEDSLSQRTPKPAPVAPK